MTGIYSYTYSFLKQLIEVIGLYSPAQYSQKLVLLSGSSLGQHFRHIIEFYECLLKQAPSETVSYDNRKRDICLEEQPLEAIDRIQAHLETLHSFNGDFLLQLQNQSLGNNAEEGSIDSSFYRELLYCAEHAIHHLAIIKIASSHFFPEINLPEHLGVAPSTIEYHKQTRNIIS